MTFEIGFVPEGWKRGQPLRVLKAKGQWPGFVSLDHTKLTVADTLDAGTVGFIKLTAEQSDAVDAWLEWWNATVAA